MIIILVGCTIGGLIMGRPFNIASGEANQTLSGGSVSTTTMKLSSEQDQKKYGIPSENQTH